ncbi:hypothetical protein HY967_01845 [Candidatus Jorgensenbacteria bacterium]|nr:hypothetical protein [Candidatus Jorgensenbacteria bacterium]
MFLRIMSAIAVFAMGLSGAYKTVTENHKEIFSMALPKAEKISVIEDYSSDVQAAHSRLHDFTKTPFEEIQALVEGGDLNFFGYTEEGDVYYASKPNVASFRQVIGKIVVKSKTHEIVVQLEKDGFVVVTTALIIVIVCLFLAGMLLFSKF